MDDALQQLYRIGTEVGTRGATHTKHFRRVIGLDLKTRRLAELEDVTLTVAQPILRSSNGKTAANRGYDNPMHLFVWTAFWPLQAQIVQEDKALSKLIAKATQHPWDPEQGKKDITVTDGAGERVKIDLTLNVVLFYNGESLAETPVMQSWLLAQEADTIGEGACLVTGKLNTQITRLHYGIRAANDKLVCHNQGHHKYFSPDTIQFPASVEGALGYASGLKHLLDSREHTAGIAVDMYLTLWTAVGLTHPIIAPTIAIFREPRFVRSEEFEASKARVAAAWQAIEAVAPNDETEICGLILTLERRYIPLRYGHLSAGQIRAGMLLLRDAFRGQHYARLSWPWTNSKRKCRDSLLYEAAWTTLTAGLYSYRLTTSSPWRTKSEEEDKDVPRLRRRWEQLREHQIKGTPLMTIRPEFTPDTEPEPADYLDHTLVESKDPLYALGCRVDLYCQAAVNAHHKKTVHRAGELKTALNNPRRWFARCAAKFEMYTQKRVQNHAKRTAILTMWRAMRGGELELPTCTGSRQKILIQKGFDDQQALSYATMTYLDDLRLKSKTPVEETTDDEAAE
jgi:hypothetical protein